jgi:hypothetical protein
MEQTMKPDDKVVLKSNWNVVYILLSIDGENATCLASDGKEVTLPLKHLEKWNASRAFGI